MLDASPLPIPEPFIYVQLKLRYRPYNTAVSYLRATQAFYTYYHHASVGENTAVHQDFLAFNRH
ncbi:hypothetical protein CCU68_19480 [Pseudomonas gingeri NCPPB 3146 = LMG 5327]|uniref:Integrase n=1 Tax=Pseudomonas gingeri NCPPB 3146 = LMG 5327 TaxID=707248 RepID=A0ABX4Y209_9PSED|nr:hypothetical protein CCU68_19480 [Pseudomonas gingeri NCPPB 3146 = LMG 5327]